MQKCRQLSQCNVARAWFAKSKRYQKVKKGERERAGKSLINLNAYDIHTHIYYICQFYFEYIRRVTYLNLNISPIESVE